MDQAIVAGLGKAPYQIELYHEELEASLFPDEASQRDFREWFIRRYSDRKPDIIIAVGPDPLKFLVEAHEKVFPNIPIIFCGSTEEMLDELKLDSHFTGVWGEATPDKTLESALRLQPSTRHVVVVGGVAAYDRKLESITRTSLQKYESKLDFTYLTDLDMPTLLDRLRHLPSDTIIYHTSIMQDAAGARFIDARQSVPLIVSAANAPVFVGDDVDIGSGTVGGNVLSFAAQGQVASSMAVRVLNGEKTRDIPVAKSPNLYVFDWRALRHWGLKESNLPPGSVILYRTPTIWEAYRRYVAGGISLVVVETLLIAGLLWQRARRRRVEEELAISTDRLRLAIEVGGSVAWDWDLKGGRGWRYGDLKNIFGIPADAYAGEIEDFRRNIHPADRAMVSSVVADARQNRKPYAAEFRVVRSDGSVCWITARGKFYYADHNDAVRMLGMAVEITERKQMEEALKKSEKKFSMAFQESPMGLTLTSAKDSRYLDVNETFEQMTGWPRDEVIGKTPFDIGVWENPSERVELVKRLLAEGSVRNYEIQLLCRDGTKRTGLGSAELIEIDNEPCVLSVVADITERKQIEEKLHASEGKLAGIVASAMDAIIAVDEEQGIVLFNAAAEKMFGCDVDEATGSSIKRFIPQRFHSEYEKHIGHFGISGATNGSMRSVGSQGTLWAVRSNGQEFPIEASISQVEAYGRKLFTVIIRDITERKMAEEALINLGGRLIEAQEEERRRVAREIHDDYNQRLAVLAIDLEELAENIGNADVGAGRRLHDLWSQVCELGADLHVLSHRLHSSTLENLGLVAGARAFCEEFADQQEIETDFTYDNVPSDIPGDVALCLFRILQEGLRNVKKHSGANRAEVRLEAPGEKLHLSISDRGRGFDATVHSSKDGIGLRSMEERLRLLGGQLQVHARPMEGTRIDAWLPYSIGSS
ncbi:ABC transporter substrate binding protein [Acidobacterium sp. S8]|uniref:ABC transporter substrate binding protein n=1 Tax=Acidobacterium sp. S8 TaxID=1641854 RepID=UPI00131CB81A|nr:ABC transporter substrate binding protein [Acidobacterium sp. S8]